MTSHETGVYITLIAKMYEMAGPIERDDQRLSRLCGCQTGHFRKALSFLIDEGKITVTDDGLFNDRVKVELEKVTHLSDKAKQAAQARWNKKPNKNKAASNATASAGHMPEQCQPKPKPEPKNNPPLSPLQILTPIAGLEAASDFIEHRKQMRKPLTLLAAKKMANRLSEHPDPAAVLNHSVENGWQGIFPDKISEKENLNDDGNSIADRVAARFTEMDSGADTNPVVPLLPARHAARRD